MHLRMFSVGGKGKQLAAFDKQAQASYLVAIEDAAAQGGYYTYETESGEPSLEFEHLLAKIEGFAQPALDRLRALQPPPLGGNVALVRKDRDWLAGYVALQHLRVPAQRERMQGMWNLLGTMKVDLGLRNSKGFIKKQMAAGHSAADAVRLRDEALDSMQAGRIKITSDPVIGLHVIQKNVGPIADYVIGMSWLVLKRFEPPFFLISDNPVQLWPPDDHPPFLGIGFATPGVQVTLPIDPMTVLVTIKANLPEKVVRVDDPGFVLELNRMLWRGASRFVYGPSFDALDVSRRAIADGEETYRRPTVEVVGPEHHPDWLPYIERARGRPDGRRKRRRPPRATRAR